MKKTIIRLAVGRKPFYNPFHCFVAFETAACSNFFVVGSFFTICKSSWNIFSVITKIKINFFFYILWNSVGINTVKLPYLFKIKFRHNLWCVSGIAAGTVITFKFLHSQMFYCIFQGGSFLAILKAYAVELLYVIEKKWHWKIVFNIIIVKITLQFCQVSLSPCAEDVIITTPSDEIICNICEIMTYTSKFFNCYIKYFLNLIMQFCIDCGADISVKLWDFWKFSSSLTAPICIISNGIRLFVYAFHLHSDSIPNQVQYNSWSTSLSLIRQIKLKAI